MGSYEKAGEAIKAMIENRNTKDLSFRELLELMYREVRAMAQESEARLQASNKRLETLAANPLPLNYDKRFTALAHNIREIKRDVKLLNKHDRQREQELEDVKERLEALEDGVA